MTFISLMQIYLGHFMGVFIYVMYKDCHYALSVMWYYSQNKHHCHNAILKFISITHQNYWKERFVNTTLTALWFIWRSAPCHSRHSTTVTVHGSGNTFITV